ncbi:MAG: hypothetical protein ACPLXM_06025 [Bacteroidales bacterium]
MNGINLWFEKHLKDQGKDAGITSDRGMFDVAVKELSKAEKAAEKINPGVAAILLRPALIKNHIIQFNIKKVSGLLVRLSYGAFSCFHPNYIKPLTFVSRPIEAVVANDAVIVHASPLASGLEDTHAGNVKILCRLSNVDAILFISENVRWC